MGNSAEMRAYERGKAEGVAEGLRMAAEMLRQRADIGRRPGQPEGTSSARLNAMREGRLSDASWCEQQAKEVER